MDHMRVAQYFISKGDGLRGIAWRFHVVRAEHDQQVGCGGIAPQRVGLFGELAGEVFKVVGIEFGAIPVTFGQVSHQHSRSVG